VMFVGDIPPHCCCYTLKIPSGNSEVVYILVVYFIMLSSVPLPPIVFRISIVSLTLDSMFPILFRKSSFSCVLYKFVCKSVLLMIDTF
jgi:hypothetical protein